MMNSSRITTIFSEVPQPGREPSAILVSLLLHCVMFVLLYLGLKNTLRVSERPRAERYVVRVMDLSRPEPKLRWSAQNGAAHPGPPAPAQAVAAGGQPSAPSVPRLLAQKIPTPQTLVQPDVPANFLLPQVTPLPTVIMWSPENTPVKKIVPPPPQEVTTASVQPVLTPPNHEIKLADVKVSATTFLTEKPSLAPSTSSPLAVRWPAPVQQVPETASKPLDQPTPARVMSLSDLRMPEGTVALPLANQTAPSTSTGSLVPGLAAVSPQAGNGNPDSKQNGNGPGQGSGVQGNKTAGASGSLARSAGDIGSQGAADTGLGSSVDPAITRIELPKDGHFGMVVVGASLAEEYPETVGLWSSRLAYTVYLHVGLAKNWILQYSVPHAVEAAATGAATRPEAPWPYVIMRPQLAPGDINADAVMVHGFINVAGRFDHLAVVFPPEFPQSKFVLSALQQWKFRPAKQNGQLTSVEVLMIIPDESE